MWMIGERNELLVREFLFRMLCRHRQGVQPNILLYCSRRGGSTWLLNILAAQKGLRYVGRTLYAIRESRWRHQVPDLQKAAGHEGAYPFRFMVGFSGEDALQFQKLAGRIVSGELVLNPTLAIRADFFQRHTDRVVFQMTSGTPMIDWFDTHFPLMTTALFRHPIPTALSIMRSRWPNECLDLLNHQAFCDTHLDGAQIDLARKIVGRSTGHDLEGHVLDWSLKMLVPFREVASGAHPEWASLAYEQLVLHPEQTLVYLGNQMNLPDIDALMRQARHPSRSVSPDTADKVQDPGYLLSRWRKKVDRSSEEALLRIPYAFGIDLYTAGKDSPRPGRLGAPSAEAENPKAE